MGARGNGRPKQRTRVAFALGDDPLRDRLRSALARDRDLEPVVDGDDAEIVVANPSSLGDVPDGASLLLLGPLDDAEAVAGTVRGVLPADAGLRTIVEALRLVAGGLLILPEAAVTDSRPAEQAEGNGAPLPGLTPRETEVLELLAAGASNKLIARRLNVSIHTAKFHVASLLHKLGASGRLEAVGIGLRAGLLML